MCAAYMGLMYPQFWLHLHNLCICSLAYIICTAYTILLYPHFCVILLTQNLPRTPTQLEKHPIIRQA
jgi:hypothetical protein